MFRDVIKEFSQIFVSDLIGAVVCGGVVVARIVVVVL
jgi:hypothetical protein